MLQHTFLHIPSIGYRTETRLWEDGYTAWQDYLDRCESCRIRTLDRPAVISHLRDSAQALANDDARYFEDSLPSAESWRLYHDFRDRTAFVDIETTGLYPGSDAITVIGLFDGTSTRTFVRGINLEEFPAEVRKYRLLVTFNGKRFDLPFIRSVFGDFPPAQGHLDLLFPLRRLGYRGGLKSIERQLGVGREGSLKQVDGFLAVLLWREYQRGNRAALDTLIRYNLEDVVNLRYLADLVHNLGAARLPIPVETLPEPAKYYLDHPFDSELVDYLSNLIHEQRFNHGL
jgi:uncharacterized protein YprB with RNaseH-like and TPR domain